MSKAREVISLMESSDRKRLLQDVLWVIDDGGKDLGVKKLDKNNSILVGYQTGFEPSVCAVQGDISGLTEADAEDIVQEFLVKKKWFSGSPKDADYIVMP